MHRLLATIVKAEETGRARDACGLVRGSFRLRVKVKGAAIGALRVPDTVVGREGTVRRDFLLPWAPRRGDLIVLDPAESRRFLAPKGAAPGRLTAPGRARLSSMDIDGDGWAEDVFSNAFVSAAVQPHRGARLLSLAGRDGRDRFARPMVHIMAGQYVLLGGAEEYLPEAGMPGDIWKASFGREAAADGRSAVYTRKLRSPEGVTLEKKVGVDEDFPGVAVLVRLSYAGKPAGRDAGEEPDAGSGAKDTVDVTPGVRMSTSVPGEVGSLNVFELASRGRLVKVRYHRPAYGRRWRWRDWKDEFFGLGAGFLVSRNEREGNALVVLFGRGRASVVNIRSDFEGPEVLLKGPRATLSKGRSVSFGTAFLPADAVAASGSSLLAVTLGRRRDGAVPVAVTLRAPGRARVPAAVLSGPRGRARAVRLRRRELPGAGAVCAASVSVPASFFPLECVVRLGGERLACRVEG